MKKLLLVFTISLCTIGCFIFSCRSQNNVNRENKMEKDTMGHISQIFEGMQLVWHDEFDGPAGTLPDSKKWIFEKGFVRNYEQQYYTNKNVACDGKGNLVFEARKEDMDNLDFDPNYDPKSKDAWKYNRKVAHYTSSSIETKGKYGFQYGTLLVRAKIPTMEGAWPAIWLKGIKYSWPYCGEIDMMEYYYTRGVPTIFGNFAWAFKGVFKTKAIPFSHFTEKDSAWVNKYHIWRMDWTKKNIFLYLDGELLNSVNLSETVNISNNTPGGGENAFANPVYLMLNLALGKNGQGKLLPNDNVFPIKYYVDYVRFYAIPDSANMGNKNSAIGK